MRKPAAAELLANDTYAYVFRMHFDGKPDSVRTRILLEDVNQSKVWHFSDPKRALDHLQACLVAVIAGRKH